MPSLKLLPSSPKSAQCNLPITPPTHHPRSPWRRIITTTAMPALAAPGLGSFQDLMELLEELDHNSRRASPQQAGLAIFVTPAEYLIYSQTELPCKVGPSDYSNKRSLLQKSMEELYPRPSVRVVRCHFSTAKPGGSGMANHYHSAAPRRLPPLPFRWQLEVAITSLFVSWVTKIATKKKKKKKKKGGPPPIVVEVMYARRFNPCEKAEERYKNYFQAKDREVKSHIICVSSSLQPRSRPRQPASQTAQELERSSIS